MVNPIQPSEVAEQALRTLPDEVIEAFNELIAENYVSGSAKVLQKDVVARVLAKLDIAQKPATRQDVFDKGWLNVEQVYRMAGWTVEYEKPVAYGGEDFAANFTFRKK